MYRVVITQSCDNHVHHTHIHLLSLSTTNITRPHAHTPIVLHQLFKDNVTLYKGTVIFTSTQRGYSPCRGWFSPGAPYRTTVARKR